MIFHELRRAAVAAALLLAATAPAAGADVDVRMIQERADGYRAEIVIRNSGAERITDWSLDLTSERTIERAWGAEMTRTGDDRYRFRPDPWTREIAAGGQAKFTVAGPPGEAGLEPRDIALDARHAAAAAPEPQPQPPQPPPPQESAMAAPPPADVPPKPAVAEPRPSSAPRREPPRREEPQTPTPTAAAQHTLAFKLQSSWESGFTAEVVVINASDRVLKPWRLEFTLPGDIVEMWNADFRRTGNGRYAVTAKSYNDEIDPGGFVTFGFKTSTPFRSRPADSRLTTAR